MITFWISVVVLIIMGLAFVLVPLLKSHKQQSNVSREDVNKAIYHDKVEDLDSDLDKGLLDQGEYDQALADLQHTLLQDAQGEQQQALKSGGNKLVTIGVAVLIPVSSLFLYKQVSTGQYTNEVAQQQPATSVQNQTQSLEVAIASLEQKLQDNPDSAEGWKMLGQSYFVIKKYDDAKQAYLKALELVNQSDPELLVLTAEASAFSNSELFADYEKSLLQKALQINPKHQRALWYSGYAAYTSSNFPAAVENWQSLLALVPENQPQVKQSLLQFLNDARSKAGMPAMEDESAVAQNDTTDVARSIHVAVQLDAAVNEEANSNDTLFIYARPAQGPKMPLSLSRMTVASLPVSVTLTKDMAMMPNMSIDTFDQVEVLARVSKSGQAITQKGDLISKGVVVDFSQSNTASVDLTIDSVVE